MATSLFPFRGPSLFFQFHLRSFLQHKSIFHIHLRIYKILILISRLSILSEINDRDY